jgi:hypothetical protein
MHNNIFRGRRKLERHRYKWHSLLTSIWKKVTVWIGLIRTRAGMSDRPVVSNANDMSLSTKRGELLDPLRSS